MTKNNQIITPALASTLILVDDQTEPGEMRVLLLKRAETMSFVAGSWVFPGGVIEPEDHPAPPIPLCPNNNQLPHAVVQAAIRETEEESGLVVPNSDLHYFSHWTTPINSPKRFSTWYLLGRAPFGQQVCVDGEEMTDALWLTAREALAACARAELKLSPPTFATLWELQGYRCYEDLISLVRNRTPPVILPKAIRGEKETVLLFNDDAGYAKSDLGITGHRYRLVYRQGRPAEIIGAPAATFR